MRARIARLKEFEWCDSCRAAKAARKSATDATSASYFIDENNSVQFSGLVSLGREVKNKTLRTDRSLTSRFFGSPIFASVREGLGQASETKSLSRGEEASQQGKEMRVCRNQCVVFFVKHILVVFASENEQ